MSSVQCAVCSEGTEGTENSTGIAALRGSKDNAVALAAAQGPRITGKKQVLLHE